MITHIRTSMWNVRFTLPPTDGRRYKENRDAIVAADSIERALTLVQEEWPSATVYGMSHVSKNKPILLDQDAIDDAVEEGT